MAAAAQDKVGVASAEDRASAVVAILVVDQGEDQGVVSVVDAVVVQDLGEVQVVAHQVATETEMETAIHMVGAIDTGEVIQVEVEPVHGSVHALHMEIEDFKLRTLFKKKKISPKPHLG